MNRAVRCIEVAGNLARIARGQFTRVQDGDLTIPTEVPDIERQDRCVRRDRSNRCSDPKVVCLFADNLPLNDQSSPFLVEALVIEMHESEASFEVFDQSIDCVRRESQPVVLWASRSCRDNLKLIHHLRDQPNLVLFRIEGCQCSFDDWKLGVRHVRESDQNVRVEDDDH